MKLLFEYTLDYIKRNRRSSISIMVAILMVTTMLSALCGMLFNMYNDNLRLILKHTGNWHGELFDYSYGRDLAVVESFESVETTMVKGPWRVAAIEDPRRDYLIWRDANAEYWASMPEGSEAITEGRVPTTPGEVALSKQYFEHHPDLKLGDSLTLPMGNRTAPDGSVLDPVDIKTTGEQLAQTGTVTLTVVGKLDVATSSNVPGYTALGYFDAASIGADEEVTIYMRFKNIGDTYTELPRIAQAVGYKQDEYGYYNLRYNSDYLMRRLVFSPEQLAHFNLLDMGQQPLVFAAMGLLASAVFVLVIHNAFALSANARLSQLGVLASIGATPRQIKRSVVLEALLLSALPLPAGLLLGQLAVKLLIDNMMTAYVQLNTEVPPMVFAVSWLSVAPAILLALLTVWWSAVIPARKVARLSPIAAIRQGETLKLKKSRRLGLLARVGLEGELASNALRARKSSYRTATVSLVLSFMTLACLVCITSASTASQSVYAYLNAYKWEEKNLQLYLRNIQSPEDYAVTRAVDAVPGVQNVVWYNEAYSAALLPPERLSQELRDAGGFEAVNRAIGARTPLFRDGMYRIYVNFVGLDDASFDAYCARLGLDPAPFYQPDKLRFILHNTIEDVMKSTKRDPVLIPFLEVQPGDVFTYHEKWRDSEEGDYVFEAEVGAITDQYPPLGNRYFMGRYSMTQFLPMSRLNELTARFTGIRDVGVTGAVLTDKPEDIAAVRTEIERICESWFGSGDYDIKDYNDILLSERLGATTVNLMFGFVAGLFAVIGLSNAWATVRGTLSARRREFAMLRSVGLPPKGVTKMLLLEALLLGLRPLLLCLPFVAALQAVFLSVNEITLAEWLPFAPWQVVVVYAAAVLTVTCAAYLVGGRQILRENIVEAVKQDMM